MVDWLTGLKVDRFADLLADKLRKIELLCGKLVIVGRTPLEIF